MKPILTFLILVLTLSTALAQKDVPEVRLTIPDKITYTQDANGDDIYGDVALTNFEPIGEITGIKANDGNLYAAINDTQTVGNHGIIILRSTNNGYQWSSSILSLSPAAQYHNLKFINMGDSLLLMLRLNNSVWVVNVHNQTLYPLGGVIHNFDAVSTLSNSLYIYYQYNTLLYRKASSNFGQSWGSAQLISNSGGYPQIVRSSFGDTLLLTYRSNIDTNYLYSSIKQLRYRETSPGSLAGVGFGVTVLPPDSVRKEFKSLLMGNRALLIYTEKVVPGYTQVRRKYSYNGGATYNSGTAIVDGEQGRSCYWIDVKPGTGWDLMANVVYYSDEFQTGPPTNSTDKLLYKGMMYNNFLNTVPSIPSFTEHPPQGSSRDYRPVIIEMTGENQLGFLWVGLHGSNTKRVYFDLQESVEPGGLPFDNNNINAPAEYELNQNYPNPFNPSTSISFSLKNDGFTSLKIYNMLGQEIESLVNENLTAGIYSYTFNASGLPSGTYFYRLTSGSYTELKIMILIK